LIGIALEHLVTSSSMSDTSNGSQSYAFGPLPYPSAWAFGYVLLQSYLPFSTLRPCSV
jgi:hypothetical protein